MKSVCAENTIFHAFIGPWKCWDNMPKEVCGKPKGMLVTYSHETPPSISATEDSSMGVLKAERVFFMLISLTK